MARNLIVLRLIDFMNLNRLVRISLIAFSLSVVIPFNQIANAEEVWRHLDANGNVLNRIICTADVCGNPNSGYSLATLKPGERYVLESTSTPTPSAAETRTATTTPTPTQSTTPTNSNTNTLDTRTVSPTPTPTSTPTLAPIITSGLGGYAVVHPDGHVCGVIVATSSDPFGNGGVMPIEYMGCPIRSRIVFQTTASSSGNVAGWHGTTVTESNGQFKIGGGTDTITVRNGVATNTSGQSWDTGNGAPAAKTTDTKTVVSNVDTRTATVVSNTDTRTATTLADNKITSILTISSISNVESRTASAANLLNTYTATEKESLLNVTLNSAKSAVVNVSTDIPNIKMAVTATKAGSKPIVFNIKTNSEGDGQIKTSKNLTGYTVTLSANGVKLDSDKAIKK